MCTYIRHLHIVYIDEQLPGTAGERRTGGWQDRSPDALLKSGRCLVTNDFRLASAVGDMLCFMPDTFTLAKKIRLQEKRFPDRSIITA